MKFSMKGQETGDLLIGATARTGLTVHPFSCHIIISLKYFPHQRQW